MHRSYCLPRLFFLVLTGLLQFVLGVSPVVAATADHLIISEVVVKTYNPAAFFGSPFIEIVNPTGSPLAMDNVYLTDGTTAPATFYYNLPLLDIQGAFPGGGNAGDFHARFPAGFTLAAGDTIAIALNGSAEYIEAYGRPPDFELFEEGASPDGVPEMLEAFPGSIGAGLGGSGNIPLLSYISESLILYSWNGNSNLVQDLDYLMWGTDYGVRIDKFGVTVGGEAYLPDTAVASQERATFAAPDYGEALRRVDADEGAELVSGGNGISGHDETSENLATTFPVVADHEPPLANPPFPVSPIVIAESISPTVPVDGQAVTISVSVVDEDEVESVVIHYFLNGDWDHLLFATQVGPEEWTVTVPAQSENTLVTWYCVATNSNGGQVVYPAGSPNFAATWLVAAEPDPADVPAKLLLTEISTTGTDQEYFEIYNPGPEAVDLSDYYVTDANYSTGDQYYYRIGEGDPNQVTVGGGKFYDFHARFPHGFTIAAGDTIVITLAGSAAFSGIFGFDPDLELYEDGAASDAVPDMRWIFGTASDNSIVSIDSTPTFSNAAETLILYHFITGENKVTDIDVYAWKDPSSTTTSQFFNKTGVTIGSHSYLPENGTNEPDAFGTENVFGNSYQRIDFSEGDQTPTGSNGVDGRDETSEDFDTTFAMLPYDPSGPPGPEPEPVKLLITEVCTKITGAEFIEIHNPGAIAVDMSRYFLTDAIYSPDNQVYWRIAEGNPSAEIVGGGAFYDFHSKFPDGYILGAGETISISLQGSLQFQSAYGLLPDLEMYEDDVTPDGIPDMAYIFGDATNNSIINRTGTGAGQPSEPILTNSAETVILYYWQDGEDQVVDIDVFFWKDPSSTSTSFLFSKTGVTVGGHTYLPDTHVLSQTPFGSESDPGYSYHRIDGNEGSQIPTGSNGVGGRDETSENFDVTFQMAPADPSGSPIPGESPPKLLFTEISTTGTAQEYIEICNPGTEDVDLSDYYLTDAIYSTGNQVYWRIAEGNPIQLTVGGGAYGDFHARFPDGYSLAAGDTIVISVAGSDEFYDSFHFFPHLELFELGAVSDTIPDMRWIFGDEINNSIINRTGSGSGEPSNPSLSNGGETVIIYHWVNGEDKVTDIDVFAWKDPSYSSTSYFFNKTGVTIGSHSYLPETGTNEFDAFGQMNDYGNSYHRIDPTEGDQISAGSNGVDGRDETSENFNTTFVMLPYDPVSRPGVVIPPEGDWQNVGFGPVVNYPSVAHTWGDFRNDGTDDLWLVLPGSGAGSILIHNAGMFSSGYAETMNIEPGIEISDCVMGDNNQNGTLDMYLTNESGVDWYFINQGEEWDWRMWGLPVDAFGATSTIATTGVEWVDTDLDGWVEVFVTNGEGNGQLLDGRFGLTDLMPHSLFYEPGTAGSAWCDLDGDRDPDLAFVTAEGIAIAIQYEPRRFTTTWLTAPPEARDIAWADYDNDGDFDFALVCLGANNVIYENLGDGTFSQNPLVHAGNDSTTGCTWGDYNNNGFLDLHVTNVGEPNVLWRNQTGTEFIAVEDTVINNSGNDLGSSWLDIDHDGDLDLYISNRDGANRFVRNNLDSANNWLLVSAIGQHGGNQSNHSALGAVIEVEVNGTVQRRYVGGQEAGPGHSPLAQYFGLGGATVVDRVTVHWPFRLPNGSFHSTEMRDVAVNHPLEIEETVYGVSAVDQVPHFKDSLMAAKPNPFNPVTVIGYSLERDAVVTLDIFDVRGRLVRRLVRGRTVAAGLHKVEWRGKTEAGSDAPSGVYIYRITAGDFTASHRMVLIK